MSVRIRDAVFETNSSSSHSVTIAENEMHGLALPKDMLRSGRIDVKLDWFGRGFHRYYQPANKLAYLLTQIGNDLEKTIRVCRVVEQHTGCKVVVDLKSREDCGVDHQSTEVGLDLIDDPERLIPFLFSENSFIQTGCDESDPGEFIETDRGREPYHAAIFTDDPLPSARFVMSFESHLNNLVFEAADTKVELQTEWEARSEIQEAMETAVVISAKVSSTETYYSVTNTRQARDMVVEILADFRERGEDATYPVKIHRDAAIEPASTRVRVGSMPLDMAGLGRFRIEFAATQETVDKVTEAVVRHAPGVHYR